MPRVTQKDIAKSLEVHVSTVSKALKGDPSVARETVERVRRAAKDLGFVPDPMLSALAAYRKVQKPQTYRASIAWIYNHSREERMSAFSGYRDYFEGAFEQARKLGYGLEEFWVEKRSGSVNALDRILQARGIRGVIVAPQADLGRRLEIAWERCAAVAIGYSLKEPDLNRVTNDHFATMTDLLENLYLRGYRRIGCYLWEVDNERMARRAHSAFLAVSREYQCRVASYVRFDAGTFLRWVRRHKPDVVVCRGREQLEVLASAGIKVPEKIGLAGYALEVDEKLISGMHHNNRRIGSASVEWLNNMLQRERLESPSCSERLLVMGSWLENGTLREGLRPGTG